MSGPLYTIRPLSDRTRFKGERRSSPFTANWRTTRNLLAKELEALDARDVVLEIDVTEAQIRQDGELYARATAASPAVSLHFESKHGPLSYATDKFPSWQDNVRAIALGLEALRRVDRYGISDSGEQYRGWKALPAGNGAGPSHLTADAARRVLIEVSGAGTGSSEVLWSRARARAHPDRNDGDRAAWDRVEEAARVLGLC